MLSDSPRSRSAAIVGGPSASHERSSDRPRSITSAPVRAVGLRPVDHLLARQRLHVVDLGEHAHVTRSELRPDGLPPVPLRQRADVGRALAHRQAGGLLQRVDVALAQARDHDVVDPRRHRQPPGDPARRHQRGDADVHHGDLVVDVQLGHDAAQRRLGQAAGDEQRVSQLRRR